MNTLVARPVHWGFCRRYFNLDNKGSEIKIKHLWGDDFIVIGKGKNGEEWKSNIKYFSKNLYIGDYDYKPESNLPDWGEHEFHILPNKDINVISLNKIDSSKPKIKHTYRKKVASKSGQ